DNPVGAALEAEKRGYAYVQDMILDLEKPGVLNWMIEGMIRARERGSIEKIQSMRDELSEIADEGNCVTGFISAGCATLNEDVMVKSTDLCGAIGMWHQAEYGEDRRMLSKHFISQHIRAAYDSN